MGFLFVLDVILDVKFDVVVKEFLFGVEFISVLVKFDGM